VAIQEPGVFVHDKNQFRLATTAILRILTICECVKEPRTVTSLGLQQMTFPSANRGKRTSESRRLMCIQSEDQATTPRHSIHHNISIEGHAPTNITKIHRHVWSRESSLQPQGALLFAKPPTICPTLTYATQFTAKQLNRQAAKAGKDETNEKAKLKKVQLHTPWHYTRKTDPI